jgi:hypothetical protein
MASSKQAAIKHGWRSGLEERVAEQLDQLGVEYTYEKHILVKRHNPELDIRFVFSNSNAKISKASKTTYAMWCRKNGYKFADKTIPEEWVNES